MELMMHGPCGAENLDASCMQNGPCNKHFPKYNEKTYFDSNGHTQYRRRDTGIHVMKGEWKLDNYNVYISKGPDRILRKISNSEASTSAVGTTNQIDEIQNYVDGRFIFPYEACWRIFDFLIHCREPAVQILNVHLEDMQRINFHEKDRGIGIQNYHVNNAELQGYILYELEKILNGFGKSVTDFGLQSPPRRASSSKQQELIFVYGHGGTGKTFLWKTIISSLRSEGKIVLAVASSGIASLLLPAGRTTHSGFKLPLELTDESFFHDKKKSQLGNLLVETNLIIWDEAPMNDKRCFKTLDGKLRDLMDAPNILFGGKTIVLGGDFRQTLPVKKDVGKEELVAASIAESYLCGNILEFTMWDEVAKQFNKQEIQKLTPPIIIVVSSRRVTKYRDVQLTATPVTYYYINPQTPEAEYAYTATTVINVVRFGEHSKTERDMFKNRKSESFWVTAKVKNVNGEAQIQGLVDKKKGIITEASIKRDLRFEDEGEVDFLSNEVIFEQLILIG
nr:DNA helicase [Tanacetum cinerariifolium]